MQPWLDIHFNMKFNVLLMPDYLAVLTPTGATIRTDGIPTSSLINLYEY